MYSTKSRTMNERETKANLAEKLPNLLPNMKIEDISLKVPVEKEKSADVIARYTL